MEKWTSIKQIRSELTDLKIMEYRETPFFSTIEELLCQWIDLQIISTSRSRKHLTIEISSRGKTSCRSLVIQEGVFTLRCYAPCAWPNPPDSAATLSVCCGEKRVTGIITVGTYRPWTLHLLSDACVDDTWAYDSLEKNDRDDYQTTLAELNRGDENCYNLPTFRQVERFYAYADKSERDRFRKAVLEKRIHVSPTPNQLNCGAYTLAAYPLLLEPYRKWINQKGNEHFPSLVVNHMEGPTWTNGFLNLCSCAGFRMFAKSVLRFLAPWNDVLEHLPVLSRMEVAPGQFLYFILRCNDYEEGAPLLQGQPAINEFVHNKLLPQYQKNTGEHPVSAIPIVGMYSDLNPDTPKYNTIKMQALEAYNSQGWEYPRLLNSSWNRFAEQVITELGEANKPLRSGIRTLRGDTGSSWETWLMSAQDLSARFRSLQREIVSVTTMCALLEEDDAEINNGIEKGIDEVVGLGDHAWNGSSPESRKLNLQIRTDRVVRAEKIIKEIRQRLYSEGRFEEEHSFAVLNTLAWPRTCRLTFPKEIMPAEMQLVDIETRRTYPLYDDEDESQFVAYIDDVKAFGHRILRASKSRSAAESRVPEAVQPIDVGKMKPLLILGNRELSCMGGWNRNQEGRWQIGPFLVRSRILPLAADNGFTLQLRITGTPPKDPYELRWLFQLPWKQTIWRGESGGGFATVGPTSKGGGSLEGIIGSVYSCGGGLSAMDPEGGTVVDFALDQAWLCGLGEQTTAAGTGGYSERMKKNIVDLSLRKSLYSPGRLELFILGNKQNYEEAFLDQGGARQWDVRCGIRSRRGEFDDTALYRFATGFNWPAEVVDSQLVQEKARRLSISGDTGVVPLSVSRKDGSVIIDLYNMLPKQTRFSISGDLVAGKEIYLADMLGRIIGRQDEQMISIDPLVFLRIILK